MMTGADSIAAILRAQGIRTVFSLAGASHTYLLDALDRDGCKILSSRHESGAVGAADGYARALAAERPERPGVALIVSEQGIANAVGGLAVAYSLGSPVVVLAAIPPEGFVERTNTIASAQLAIVEPVCKWAAIVPSSARLAEAVQCAIRASLEGRPGPVVLFIPQDQFRAEVPEFVPQTFVWEGGKPDPEALDHAAQLLRQAKRPIAIAGMGALRGRAADALQALAAKGVPVLGNGSGRGLVAEDGEQGWSWPYAQTMANQADCVIVLGEILTQRLGFGLPPRFAADASFIEISTDPESFDRNRQTNAALCGEPGSTLESLLQRIEANDWSTGWLKGGLEDKRALLDCLAGREGGTIHPLALGQALAPYINADTMLVGDGADIQNWMYGALTVTRPGGFMDHFPLGAMGSGTALAIGAAAALAEQAEREGGAVPATLLVTGDGAIGFHPAELHAAALANLNLKIVVGNDGAWGTEAHGQFKAIGRTINTDLGTLPYAKLAEAFGCEGLTCDIPEELAAAVAKLFAIDGPALLDVGIDPEAGALLKTDPLASSIHFNDLEEGQRKLAPQKDLP